MKIIQPFIFLILLLLSASCGSDDDPDNGNVDCNDSFSISIEIQDELDATIAAATTFGQNPTVENCEAYVDSIDDYISDENPIKLVDAFVDRLNLLELGFESVQPKLTGRPGYHPSTMLKLYIYGYLNN